MKTIIIVSILVFIATATNGIISIYTLFQIKMIQSECMRINDSVHKIADQQSILKMNVSEVQSTQVKQMDHMTYMSDSMIGLRLQFRETTDISGVIGPTTIPEKIEDIRKKISANREAIMELRKITSETYDSIDSLNDRVHDINSDLSAILIRLSSY